MGQLKQKAQRETSSLSSVTDIKTSSCGFGIGLFATKDIQKGSILTNSVEVEHRPLATFINDSDFSYPIDFSIVHLTLCFSTYMERDTNNIIETGPNQFSARRLIKEGEEITKRYGLLKWSAFLTGDILGEGFPTRLNDNVRRKQLNAHERQKAFENLKDVLRRFGYDFNFPMQC